MTCCPPVYAVLETHAATPPQLPPDVGELPVLVVVVEGAFPAQALTVPRKDVLVTICTTMREDARKKVRTWHPVAVGVSRGGAHRPPFCLKRVEGNEQGKSNRA